MTENPKDKLREHDFDGIREYDNDLPRWWVNLFKVTIVFAVCYMVWYHLPWFPSKSLVQEYDEQTQKKESAEAATPKTETFDFAAAAKDSAVVAKGKEAYTSNCVACHGTDGGGGIGPNLTDDFWIHGSKFSDLLTSVNEGYPAKGMPSWKSILGAEKVNSVIAYIVTLQGTKPATPKASQGEPGKLGL